ncbi:hypothetical protein V5K00_RS21855 [Enterobacter asburiae]
MYLIEVNEIELERDLIDSEYFTASEDEYFSAEESSQSYSMPSSSRYSSERSVALQEKNCKRCLVHILDGLFMKVDQEKNIDLESTYLLMRLQ